MKLSKKYPDRKDAETVIKDRTYAAAAEVLERLSRRGLVCKGGDSQINWMHVAHEVSEFAAAKLREHWSGPPPGYKVCTSCGETKHLRNFNKDSRRDDYIAACRSCMSNKAKAYQARLKPSYRKKRRQRNTAKEREQREAKRNGNGDASPPGDVT